MSNVVMQMVQPAGVAIQGKWGYYLVSYQDFLIIKQQHKHLLQAFRDLLGASRRYRKTFYRQKVKPSRFLRQLFRESELTLPYSLTDKWCRERDIVTDSLRVVRSLYGKYLAYYQAVRKPYREFPPTGNRLAYSKEELQMFDRVMAAVMLEQETAEKRKAAVDAALAEGLLELQSAE